MPWKVVVSNHVMDVVWKGAQRSGCLCLYHCAKLCFFVYVCVSVRLVYASVCFCLCLYVSVSLCVYVCLYVRLCVAPYSLGGLH